MKHLSYQREQVVDIINSVLVRIQAPAELSRDVLSQELTELKAIIDALRNDLHAARPGDISNTHIPMATDELDAVVGATEQATVTIMDSCDEILNSMKHADASTFLLVEKSIVKIFEACTFQDITGQRIKKVTNSLKQIDAKIKSVLVAIEGQLVNSNHSAPAAKSSEFPLLNGPALPAYSVSQDEIDRLLAEFDSPKEV